MVAPIVAAGIRVAAGRGAKARAAQTIAATTHGSPAKEQRISNLTAVFMLSLALIVDLLQFFLTLSIIFVLGSIFLTFLAAAIFGIWFALLGVNYLSGSKAGPKILASMGGVVVELVPLVNALPAATISVGTLVLISRIEDRSA